MNADDTTSDVSESTDDSIVLLNRALASRDPLELAIAGFLSGYKGNTFRSYRTDLQTFLAWCLQHDLNPLEAKRPHMELYPLEFAAFLTAAREMGLGLCGLRVAEACSLNVESLGVDGGYDTLKFIGKGSKPAEVPLPIPVMRAVRVAVGTRESGPLLLNKAGKRLDQRAAHRMVRRIAAKANGNTDISPHSLRRTFCTSGLVSGVPMRDMQIAMRHADPRTTGKYDMAKNNKDRHASHRVASFLAGMTG